MDIFSPGSWATTKVSDECMSSRGILSGATYYRVSPVRLTFLLPFGIGAIRELDDVNLKLGSLDEYLVMNGRPFWSLNGMRGYLWYGMC